MKKRLVLKICTICIWIIVIIPVILLAVDCLNSYIYGTSPGFNVDYKIYGVSAFFNALFFYFAFLFPFFILWFIVFTCAVTLTIITGVICYRDDNVNKNEKKLSDK